jgi:hypothetical protein
MQNLLESCLACPFRILLAKADISEDSGAPIKAIIGYTPQTPTLIPIKENNFCNFVYRWLIANKRYDEARGQCYKTFYSCNLQMDQ